MTLASMSNHRKNVHEHNKRREDSPFRARGNYAAQGAQDPDHGRTTRITHVTRDATVGTRKSPILACCNDGATPERTP